MQLLYCSLCKEWDLINPLWKDHAVLAYFIITQGLNEMYHNTIKQFSLGLNFIITHVNVQPWFCCSIPKLHQGWERLACFLTPEYINSLSFRSNVWVYIDRDIYETMTLLTLIYNINAFKRPAGLYYTEICIHSYYLWDYLSIHILFIGSFSSAI